MALAGGETGDPHWQVVINGLEFSYGTTAVFAGLSFDSSARVSLLRGPSGCGKTTFLKLLYGLLTPCRSGHWLVPSPGYLVLQADALVPWFSGRQNIERFSPALWAAVYAGPFYSLIAPFLDRRACEMSYGQRRTIELVRAFSAQASLLLLDEPFNFLDAEKRRFFLDYLNGAHGPRPENRVFLTTHYVEEVAIRGADCFEFLGDMPHRELHPCVEHSS